jgi:hypothetical protein
MSRHRLVLLATAIAAVAGTATIVAGSGGAAVGDGALRDPAAVDVTVTNLGNLNVTIDASVTAGDRALAGADVVAYADMTEMPLAHTQGPLAMQERAGEPGRYVTETTVPMPGGYEFRIAVRSPVRTEQRRTLFVGVVGR